MAPAKVGSKKAAKKPSIRKDVQGAASTKSAKPKQAATAHVKQAVKPAAAKPAAKASSHKPATHVTAKAPAHRHAHAAPPHKAAVKAPAARPHAPAKHQTASSAGKSPAKAAPTSHHAASRHAAPSSPRTMPASVGKTANQKIIAPAAQHAPAGLPATPVPTPAAPQPTPQQLADKKPVHSRHGFKVNEWIVYPAHGVGRIVAIEEQEIAGIALELFVITFEKDKMTLRVPTGKSESVGMRKLAEETTVKKAIETLKGRARVKRTMWSRRAQEYEAKINSGDLVAIAEVVRDLYRSESQPEQSYSERQLYEAALDRMAREIAAVEKLDERGAIQRITDVLAKSARGRGVAAAEAA